MRKAMMMACAAAVATPVAAQIVPVGVTASDTFFTYSAANLINGSGLAGGLHNGQWTNKWMNDGRRESWLLFDLGRPYQLSNALVWNYGGGCCGSDRNVNLMTVLTSADGFNFINRGSFGLTNVTSDSFAADTLALSGLARFVRFDIQSNRGDYWTGLSEVRFNGAAVPEPATWAMMIVGVGATGAALRRRRRLALA